MTYTHAPTQHEPYLASWPRGTRRSGSGVSASSRAGSGGSPGARRDSILACTPSSRRTWASCAPPWRKMRLAMHPEPSLAKLVRDHGQYRQIEKVQRGTEWVAVQRESGGDYVRIVAGHDLGSLRYRIEEAERDEPEEREPDLAQ